MAQTPLIAIPAKARIQIFPGVLDPGFCRGDGLEDFLRDRQFHSNSFYLHLYFSPNGVISDRSPRFALRASQDKPITDN
jgi:hypothetical protein